MNGNANVDGLALFLSVYSFITYRSCRHLDGKHTVFGKLVGGLDTLSEMEKIEVDNKDRPIENILIEKVHIFVDPYQEADDQLAQERQDEQEKRQKAILEEKKRKEKAQPLKVFRPGVGKYLNTDSAKKLAANATPADDEPIGKKNKKTSAAFGNFSSW